MRSLTEERAREIGRAALARVLAEHTYTHRGEDVDRLFRDAARPQRSAA
jgi:spore maturation protein CgeB